MKLILASQSPRRKALLGLMGLKFDVIPSNFEEYFDNSRSVEEVVEELGLGKALDVAKNHPEDIVIGSDLIVVLDGKQLGKPESEEEAWQMLRNFSGRTHQLIASVAVVCLNKGYKKVSHETAEVTFDVLTEDFIKEYVATGTTYDKAGGYAIQHPMMKPHIVQIKGRKDTVIGMPTNVVAEMLNELGIDCRGLDVDNEEIFNDPRLVD